MKDIPSQRGARYIRSLVAQGEHQNQDFKFQISDARKIARSISAFANNSGGRLLVGVKDNGVIAGVRNEEDVYVIEQAASRYCRPEADVNFEAYGVSAGVTVIVATVATSMTRPVRAQDTDGRWKSYYRVDDENIVAHPLMEEVWRLRQDPDRPLVLNLSILERRILELFDSRPDDMDVDDVALALHSSMAATRRSLIALATAGVLDFRFDGTRFLLHRPE